MIISIIMIVLIMMMVILNLGVVYIKPQWMFVSPRKPREGISRTYFNYKLFKRETTYTVSHHFRGNRRHVECSNSVR